MSLSINKKLERTIQNKFPNRMVKFSVHKGDSDIIQIQTPCSDENIHYEVCNRIPKTIKKKVSCIELHFEDHENKEPETAYKKYIDKINELVKQDEDILSEHRNNYSGQYYFRLNYKTNPINNEQDLMRYLAAFIERFDKIINEIESQGNEEESSTPTESPSSSGNDFIKCFFYICKRLFRRKKE